MVAALSEAAPSGLEGTKNPENAVEIARKILDGGRITPGEALALYRLPLNALGTLADARRRQVKAAAYAGRGNEIVTYIVDRNINYTNVCNVYCKFCAFYRTEK